VPNGLGDKSVYKATTESSKPNELKMTLLEKPLVTELLEF